MAASRSDPNTKTARLYSSKFSTILRVSRNTRFLDVLVRPEDTSGADPLPNYLAKTGLLMGTFVANRVGEEGRMISTSPPQESPKTGDETQNHDGSEPRYGLLVYPHEHWRFGQ